MSSKRLQSKIDDHHLCTSEGSAKKAVREKKRKKEKTELLVSGAVRCSRLAAKQLSWRLTVGLISWVLGSAAWNKRNNVTFVPPPR